MGTNYTDTTETAAGTLDQVTTTTPDKTRWSWQLVTYLALSLLAAAGFTLWLCRLPSPTSPLEHWLGIVTIASAAVGFVFCLLLLIANALARKFRGQAFLCEEHFDDTAMVLIMCIFPGGIGAASALGVLFPDPPTPEGEFHA